jgi:hypothetical protein
MKIRKLFAILTIAGFGTVAVAAAGVAALRQPMALAAVGDSFAAPYGAVWDATLRGLGVVKTTLADKATGFQGGTQVISVSFRIQVVRAGENRTDVVVTPFIHDSLLSGFTPGPTNNPWLDLFARMHNQLG